MALNGVARRFMQKGATAVDNSRVQAQTFEAAAINTFLQVADYYLIAHALAKGYAVVTHEVPANTLKKIKIPNVCIGLNIKCVTPFEMLRVEKARFVLALKSDS